MGDGRIGEMVELVREAVTAPGINQSRGGWNERGDCCMGSRIAHALGMDGASYLEGADEWARRMGLNRAQVTAMLQDAGAGHDPLGPRDWPECPEAVWRNLSRMEEPPGLRGRDLSRLNLAHTSLRGMDLREANLGGCNLRGALLDNSNLAFASLSGASLRDASLRCANLAGADLREADLTGADLAKANLRGALLEGAMLALAKLDQTRMARQAIRPPAVEPETKKGNQKRRRTGPRSRR